MAEPQLSTSEEGRHALPSGLIHDLRNLLNLIIGYSEMLMEQVQEQGQDDFLRDLQKTYSAGKQLLALVNDNFYSIRALDPGVGISEPREEQITPTQQEPAAKAFSEYAAAGELASGAAEGLLLVVDDVEANREVLSRQCEHQGYVVATAENGRQALEILREKTFDLVLLDIMMPEMDGYEVLRRLKVDEALCHIPVIMISGLSASSVEAGVRPAFPPSLVVKIKALVCELPYTLGIPLSRLSVEEIRQHVISQGLVAEISVTVIQNVRLS